VAPRAAAPRTREHRGRARSRLTRRGGSRPRWLGLPSRLWHRPARGLDAAPAALTRQRPNPARNGPRRRAPPWPRATSRRPSGSPDLCVSTTGDRGAGSTRLPPRPWPPSATAWLLHAPHDAATRGVPTAHHSSQSPARRSGAHGPTRPHAQGAPSRRRRLEPPWLLAAATWGLGVRVCKP